MSNIPLPSSLNAAKVATFVRQEGEDTLHVQAMVIVNPFAPVTGDLTAAGQTTVCPVADAATALVRISGTFAGSVIFEASDDDGTTWLPVLGARSESGAGELGSGVVSNTTRAWRVNTAGYAKLRVKCATLTSGSIAVRVSPSPFGA